MVRIHPDPPTDRAELGRIEALRAFDRGRPEGEGAVAQLGERLLCKQEVIGSIPFSSTNSHQEVQVIIVHEFRRDSRQA
jgi:hypothetical protein